MDYNSSDFSLSDFNLTDRSYHMNSDKITPIATFLILILIIMLIGFFINNLSNSSNNKNLEKLEAVSHIESKVEIKPENKKNIYENIHPASIKQTLNETNQELNSSINQLTNLLNKTTGENQTYNEEIKTLEKTIEDLKSQVIILQSKLLDYDLQKPETKPVQLKPVEKKPVEQKMQNINITTDRPEPPISYTYNNFQDDVIIYDPIANYDRLKLTDPLVDPRGRSSADQIPTPQVAAQLNFPTQGVIDRYHRVGLLIAVDNDDDSRYYNSNNKFDDFYGKQNNKKLNILESTADYSMGTSMSPTYNADIGKKYNGVEIVSDNSSTSTNNTNTYPTSVYTSTSPPSITRLNPDSSKSKKKHKNKKNKHKKEHFGIEGFTNEDFYETFESDDDYDYNGDINDIPIKVLNDSRQYPRIKYPYFNEDEDFDIGDNFTNLENQSIENFGNLESNSRKNNKNNTNFNLNNGDNSILELIGKKITDNWYKYFTSISVGNKIIKINVHNRNRRELYSGDIVYIPEVGKRYRVQIDEMDMIEYNPYFF
jgi:hypothetical protein